MGLGSSDFLDDGDGDGDGGGCKGTSPVSCSICLEVVMDVGGRSWARLQCGHQFHLDCIGSAFNAKGAMQCPNCRKIEKGQWLYANGCRPVSEFNMEDWAHDDDLYDLSYAEMSFWCPFASLPSALDEGEFSSTPSHPCPYFAYLAPIHSTSSGSITDGSGFNNHWSGPLPSEASNSYAFPSVDPHYRLWDQSSPFTPSIRASGTDQASISPVTQRAARNSSDMIRPGMHPFIMGHSSAGRGPTSVRASMHPPFPVARPRDRQQAPRTTTTTTTAAPVIPSGRRSSNNHRMMMNMAAQVASSGASSSDQSTGLYFLSSGRGYQEVDRSRFHGWQHRSSFPIERDSSIWAPPPFQQTSSADNRQRSQYHQS